MANFILKQEEKEAIQVFIRIIETECEKNDGNCENCPLSTICCNCEEAGFGLADCLDNWLEECKSK